MKTASIIVAIAGLVGTLWGFAQTKNARGPGAVYEGLFLLAGGAIALIFGAAGWLLS
jgi:hypothetical protein